MSGENQGKEYIKIIADIIEKELELEPEDRLSENPTDRRVFIYNQGFILPTYKYMFIVLSEVSNIIIANNNYPMTKENGSLDERQELIVKKEIGVDVMSRNAEARQRKEEVVMALVSRYSQGQQEANGFRLFPFSVSFLDISQVEGAAQINRYRASLICHVKYEKQKAVDYFEAFDYNIVTNS